MKELEKLRKGIDRIDLKILGLLNERNIENEKVKKALEKLELQCLQ